MPPVSLVTFWLWWRAGDERARALSPEDALLFDPHGFVLVFGSALLLGLVLLVGLVLAAWTVRLVRRRARAAWLPVVLNAIDLLPLPALLLLLLFLVSAPVRR